MSATKKIGLFARLSRILLAAEDGVTLIQPEEVVITDRTKGGKVERKATDGTLTTIEDGTYELPDGFRFTIVGGFITEVGDADNAGATEAGTETQAGATTTPETNAAEEGAAAPGAEAAPPVPGLDELTQRVAALEALMAEIKAMLTEANATLAKDTEAATKAETAYTAMSATLVELSNELKTFNETAPAGGSRTNPGAVKKNDQVKQEKRQATATALGKVMQRTEADKAAKKD